MLLFEYATKSPFLMMVHKGDRESVSLVATPGDAVSISSLRDLFVEMPVENPVSLHTTVYRLQRKVAQLSRRGSGNIVLLPQRLAFDTPLFCGHNPVDNAYFVDWLDDAEVAVCLSRQNGRFVDSGAQIVDNVTYRNPDWQSFSLIAKYDPTKF